jgi:peptidoglycan/LPS O-acetylase OafA/YrhL
VETTVSSHAVQPGRSAPRLPGLDLLRALAIGWVMLCHANGFGFLPSDLFGWMGVDLFFVLSGFLIASQLLRPWILGRRPDYGRFFARRLLRTLPAYLAVVAVYFAFPAVWDRDNLQPLWQFLCFTQNWLIDPTRSNSFSHAWSLCVEEQFYLVLPLVVVLVAPLATPRRILALVVGMLLLGMALRGWFWLHDVADRPFDIAAQPRGGAYMRLIYYPTWTRLDALLAGVCAAMVKSFRPALWARLTARPNRLLAMGVAGVAASILFFGAQIAGFWPSVFGFPLLAVSMALMVMAATAPGSIIGRRAIPGAGALATGAYSLYLSHKLAYRAVVKLLAHAPAWVQPTGFVLAILAALALGAALYWLVERPFLNLRDRFEGPSRSPLSGTLRGSAADAAH